MIYALYAIAALAGLMVLIVSGGALRSSDYTIARSLLIAATPQQLFPYINNLKKFQEWNPYKDKDPQARNEFSGPEAGLGAVFHWSGNAQVGEGIMTILDSIPDGKVSLDLKFLKPFPGHNMVDFTLAPQPGGTLVTWSMKGKFALVPKIVGLFINLDKMIGADFENGLQRLKKLI